MSNSEKTKDRTAFITYEFAKNGWMDWICSNCGTIHNDDVHVYSDWEFCPYCGKKFVNQRHHRDS